MRGLRNWGLAASIVLIGVSCAQAQPLHIRDHGVASADLAAMRLVNSLLLLGPVAATKTAVGEPAIGERPYFQSRPLPLSPITRQPLALFYNSPTSAPDLVLPGIRLERISQRRDAAAAQF